MYRLFDSFFVYFGLPALVAGVLLFSIFYVPQSYIEGVSAYFLPVILLVAAGKYLFPRGLELSTTVMQVSSGFGDRICIFLLSAVVIIAGPIDIYINGFKLLNPSTYAEFNGVGRYVRHFSSLCWILIPVSFLMVRNPLFRMFVILYALLFPILIIDRNRLLLSIYVFVFCYSMLDGKNKSIWFYVSLIVFVFGVFAAVGYFRSGGSFIVPSSGNELVEGYFPLREYFLNLPEFFQQIGLYISAPVFNFATVYSLGFENSDFLMSQLSPFSRDQYPQYPHSPVLVARYNVGTEFFPQLMYGGISLVYAAIGFMFVTLLMSVLWLKKAKNIFSLLVFFKISHAVIFMGFAPQFYILLNCAFVFMMMAMAFSSWLLDCCLVGARKGEVNG